MTTAENVMTATTAIAAEGNSGAEGDVDGVALWVDVAVGAVDEDAEVEGDV